MKTINSINQLEPYGIVPLTGEADALMLRILCDVTENGRKLLGQVFGIPDMQFAEPWNHGSTNDPHVGSIMLYHGWAQLIGIFALLGRGGCREVFTLSPKMPAWRIANQQHELLRAYRTVMHQVTEKQPVDDELREMVTTREQLLAPMRLADLADEHTAYGFLSVEVDEKREWLEFIVKAGWCARIFSYGVPGSVEDRCVHQMSGRVV